MALQQLRSSTANKRPTAGAMSDGQLAVNTNATNPGLFFKDADGSVRKVGPVFIGSAAPNASPASGGSTGHSVGEQWLDNSGGTYVLKIWDGTAWRSESGTFVDVSGDNMTGNLTLGTDKVILNATSGAGTFASEIKVEGSNTPSGLYSGISRFGSLLIGTSSEAVGNARLAIDSGNGNITSVGSATFAGDVTIGGYNGSSSTTDGVLLGAVGGVYSQLAAATAGTGVVFQGMHGASATSVVKANGSATFNNTVAAASFFGDATGTAQVWYGGATGTSIIKADGSATFDGGIVTKQEVYVQGTTTSTQRYLNFQDAGTSNYRATLRRDAWYLGAPVTNIGDVTPSGANIVLNMNGAATFQNTVLVNRTSGTATCFQATLSGSTKATINADGSATFAGHVDIGNPSTGSSNSGVKVYSNGAIYNYTDNSLGTSKNFKVINTADSEVITFGNDGSATFAGDGHFKCNGTAHADMGVQFINDGEVKIYRPTGGGGSVNLISGSAGVGSPSEQFSVKADGTASFNGNVTSKATFLTELQTGYTATDSAFKVFHGSDTFVDILNNGTATFQNSSTTTARVSAHGFTCRDNYGSPTSLGNGIMSPAANTLALTTNSAERLRITSGNFQITDPSNSTGLKSKISFVTESPHQDEVAHIGFDRTATAGGAPTDIVFANGTVGGVTEKMRLNNAGQLLNGTTATRSGATSYGSTAPAVLIERAVNSHSNADLTLINNSSSAYYPKLTLAVTKGSTAGSHGNIGPSEAMGYIVFAGSDGTNLIEGARIASITDGSTSTNSMPTRLAFYTNGGSSSSPTERFKITSGGKVRAPGVYSFTTTGGGPVYVESDGDLLRYTSSLKYKTDVETIEDARADAILNCRPVWYRSKCENDIKGEGAEKSDWGWYGFIAEEVAEVEPRLVSWATKDAVTQEDGSVETVERDPADYEAEGVRYDNFVPLLVNLVKRQQQAIETLEAKVAALEAG